MIEFPDSATFAAAFTDGRFLVAAATAAMAKGKTIAGSNENDVTRTDGNPNHGAAATAVKSSELIRPAAAASR